MGIGDFFRRRRARESAIAAGAIESANAEASAEGSYDGAPISPDPVFASRVSDPTGGPLALPGGDALELGKMIAEAIQTGTAQVSSESHVVVMRGSGLREEIRALLEGRGIDLEHGGEIDAADAPGLQADILEALGRHRIAPSDPSGLSGSDPQR